MKTISDFILKEKFYTSSKTIIYRCISKDDDKKYILKLLNKKNPSSNEILNFKKEFNLISKLNNPQNQEFAFKRYGKYIIKGFEIIKSGNSFGIILEDILGNSLDKIFKNRRIELDDFLDIAIKISRGLFFIHENNIIHKDLNPSNIIYNPETAIVKIIDFNIASDMGKEDIPNKNINTIIGTFSYISPEQTGRMNRKVDYRTDFYSLGITFYKMLTGKHPFDTSTPIEKIYSHIAQNPKELSEIDKNIPAVISKIIQKMMAKNSEDRYQNAFFLQKDFEKCNQMLKNKKEITDFRIAVNDISEIFKISPTLYGREKEIEELKYLIANDFKNDVVFIKGADGIGKTTFINELKRFASLQRKNFANGKFQKESTNDIYHIIIQSFCDLLKFIISFPEEKLNSYRKRILLLPSKSIQILNDMIPGFNYFTNIKAPNKIITKRSNSEITVPLIDFIKIFADKGMPLILFLDDLQWAKKQTLNWIKTILLDKTIDYFMLIGTYREQEVNILHPLSKTIDSIKNKKKNLYEISLLDLDLTNYIDLLRDSLHTEKEKVIDIAKICYQKTKGNPFYLNLFLNSLYNEKIIFFDNSNLKWNWDIQKILRYNISDNVINFMIQKLKKLSVRTLNILKIASCIGLEFTYDDLLSVEDLSIEQIDIDIIPALKEELIQITNINSEDKSKQFKFTHTKVLKATSNLLKNQEREQYHYKLGYKYLKQYQNNKKLNGNILNIAKHLNIGYKFLTNDDDKKKASKITLLAVEESKKNVNFTLAYNYLTNIFKLYDFQNIFIWQRDYDFTLKICQERALLAFLTHNYDTMNKFIDLVLKQAKTIFDKTPVYKVKISYLISQNKTEKAIETGFEIIKSLDIKLKNNSTKFSMWCTYIRLNLILKNKSVKYFENLPKTNNQKTDAFMSIITDIAATIYRKKPLFFLPIILKQIQLTLKHGNSFYSGVVYSNIGILFCSILKFDLGYKFGELALKFSEKSNISKLKPKVYFNVHAFITHFKKKFSIVHKKLIDNYKLSLNEGDFEYAYYSLLFSFYYLFFKGTPLFKIVKSFGLYDDRMDKFNKSISVNYKRIVHQVILNLTTNKNNPTIFNGPEFDELSKNTNLNENEINKIYYLFKIILNYIFGKYEDAFEYILKGNKYLYETKASVSYTQYLFYKALVISALYNTKSKKISQKYYLNEFKKILKEMKELSYHAPENYLNKYYLLQAEFLKNTQSNFLGTIDLYKKAILFANGNNLMHEEALANELLGEYYLVNNENIFAGFILSQAKYLYKKWGAKTKSNQIKQKYDKIINLFHAKEYNLTDSNFLINASDISENESQIITTASTTATTIDIASIVKASITISKEILLNGLLEKMMGIVVKNVGAEKGIFLMPDGENLYIETVINKDDIEVLQHILLADFKLIPKRVINYSVRMQESVVLDNACKSNVFSNDPYITKNFIKSIICYPVYKKNILVGILYLENNLSQKAFTYKRLEIIKILSGQIAISIENAKLYEKLETDIKQRKEAEKELKKTIDELEKSKDLIIKNEKLASIGTMAAGIAHEINNPAQAIKFSMEALKLNINDIRTVLNQVKNISPNEEQSLIQIKQLHKFLDKIEINTILEEVDEVIESNNKSIKKIENIVNSTKRLAHPKSNMVFANINTIIKDALILVENQIKYHIKTEIHLDPNIADFKCLPQELCQVFINMLINAKDAILEKKLDRIHGLVKITTNYSVDKENIIIIVEDNGIGIEEDAKNRIFDPFFTTKKIGNGTGLGLNLSHRIIILQHKGKIMVNSKLGEGTIFTINLPVESK